MKEEIKIAIYLVDDDSLFLDITEKVIKHGCEVVHTIRKYTDFTVFIKDLEEGDMDIIFLDINMNDNISLSDKLEQINNKCPLAYTIVLTSSIDRNEHNKAMLEGAYSTICKGGDGASKYIKAWIDKLYNKIHLRKKILKSYE